MSYSTGFSAVSIFDGLAAAYQRPRWEVGMIAGSQPEAQNYGYSSAVREYGAYFTQRSLPGPRGRWSESSTTRLIIKELHLFENATLFVCTLFAQSIAC